MNSNTLSSETRRQIAAVSIAPDKPLIICDVDEVVLHFLRGLEEHLAENGLWLDPASFALTGNIKYSGTDDPYPANEIGTLLERFFEARVGSLDVIDGASDGLHMFASEASIIMLTNMPHKHRAARITNLQNHAIPYPVISNSGRKGPAVRELARGVNASVIFLDDTPENLHSVVETCPEVATIHFIPDIRFSKHLSVIKEFSSRTDNWIDASRHMRSVIGN
jgi:hypothetical protein